MAHLIGSNDSSVERLDGDLFEISQYVSGLTKFVRTCVTPMTISIQGDWGSGKTSMMSMVKEQLGDSVIPVWFNTWQYSQFNMSDDLAISFLGRLIKTLQVEQSTSSAALNKTFALAYKAIKKAGRIAVDHFAGGEVLSQLDELAQSFSKGEDDVAEAINNLKDEFQKSVDAKLKESGKDRLVVFVDDLDRLNPGKAVELLEVLKVFLDCERCVFILAIDYSVVSQGVKEKYGSLIGEDKGKSFFDKIIQVPFKMPVAHYKVDKFIIEMFKQVGIDLAADGDANAYVNLIQASVGCNPRTMKRLFNAYLLLDCISSNVDVVSKSNDPKKESWNKQMLFAILCCQHAFEDLYNFMVRNSEDFAGSDLLEMMRNPQNYRSGSATEDSEEDKTANEKLAEAFKKHSDESIQRMAIFMDRFIKVADKDHNNALDTDEILALGELLHLTTITSAGNEEVVAEDSNASRHRRLNRQIMTAAIKKVAPTVKAKGKNCESFPVYQCRKDNEVYKAHWADGYAHIVIPEKGHFEVDYLLMSNLDTDTLTLRIYTVRKRDFNKDAYEEYFNHHALVTEHGFVWSADGRGVEKVFENIGTLTEDSKEQKILAQKIADIVNPYMEIM